jgi:hypothetical protein
VVAIINNPTYTGGLTDPSGQNVGQAMNGIASAFMNTAQGDVQRAALQQAAQKQAALRTIGDVFAKYNDASQDYQQDAPDYKTPQPPPQISLADPATFYKAAATLGDPGMLGKVLQFGSALQGGPNAPGVVTGAIPSNSVNETPQYIDQKANAPKDLSQGSILVNPQTGVKIAENPAADKAAKFQVIGEDQFGNKQYGYPPEPGATPAPQTAAPVIDPNLHGQAFLQTLDPQTQSQVQAIIDGRAPYPTGFLLRTPYGQKLATLVTQADPSFESGNATARVALQRNLASGQLGQSNNALNTAIGHLGALSEAADALHNGSIPILNTIGNFYGAQTGAPAVPQFNTISSKVADEVTRAYRGAGGAEADVQRELGNINSSQSPAQLHSAIAATAELLRSKIEANQNQARSIMGPIANVPQMILPQAQATLDRLSGRAGQQSAQPSAASQPQGQPMAPVQGAKQASDGNWYVPNPSMPGKYLRVDAVPQ